MYECLLFLRLMCTAWTTSTWCYHGRCLHVQRFSQHDLSWTDLCSADRQRSDCSFHRHHYHLRRADPVQTSQGQRRREGRKWRCAEKGLIESCRVVWPRLHRGGHKPGKFRELSVNSAQLQGKILNNKILSPNEASRMQKCCKIRL